MHFESQIAVWITKQKQSNGELIGKNVECVVTCLGLLCVLELYYSIIALELAYLNAWYVFVL